MCSKISVPCTSNDDENFVFCIIPRSPHAFTSISSCTSVTSEKSSQLPSSGCAVNNNNDQERTWLPYPQRLGRTTLGNGGRGGRCRCRRGRYSSVQCAGWLACRWSLTRTSWEVRSDYRGIVVTGPAGRRFQAFFGLSLGAGKKQNDDYYEGERSKVKTRLQQRSGMYVYYTKHHKTSVLFWLRG